MIHWLVLRYSVSKILKSSLIAKKFKILVDTSVYGVVYEDEDFTGSYENDLTYNVIDK